MASGILKPNQSVTAFISGTLQCSMSKRRCKRSSIAQTSCCRIVQAKTSKTTFYATLCHWIEQHNYIILEKGLGVLFVIGRSSIDQQCGKGTYFISIPYLSVYRKTSLIHQTLRGFRETTKSRRCILVLLQP